MPRSKTDWPIVALKEAYGQPPKGELGASVEGWPGGPFPFKDEFYAVAKQMRPELYVLQTDGCCWSSSQRDKSAVQETVDGPDICPEPYNWPKPEPCGLSRLTCLHSKK